MSIMLEDADITFKDDSLVETTTKRDKILSSETPKADVYGELATPVIDEMYLTPSIQRNVAKKVTGENETVTVYKQLVETLSTQVSYLKEQLTKSEQNHRLDVDFFRNEIKEKNKIISQIAFDKLGIENKKLDEKVQEKPGEACIEIPVTSGQEQKLKDKDLIIQDLTNQLIQNKELITVEETKENLNEKEITNVTARTLKLIRLEKNDHYYKSDHYKQLLEEKNKEKDEKKR